MAIIYADDIAYYLVNNRYPYTTFEQGRGYFWPREAFLFGLQRIWSNPNAGEIVPQKGALPATRATKGSGRNPVIQYPQSIRRIKYDYSRRSRAYGYTMPTAGVDVVDDYDVNEWYIWVWSYTNIANRYIEPDAKYPSAVGSGSIIRGSEFTQFIDILDQIDEGLQEYNSYWDSSNRCQRSCQIACQTACQTTCQACNTSQCHNQKCGFH